MCCKICITKLQAKKKNNPKNKTCSRTKVTVSYVTRFINGRMILSFLTDRNMSSMVHITRPQAYRSSVEFMYRQKNVTASPHRQL